MVNDLRRAGYTNLPTEEQLADIRRLSSRSTAVEMLPAIRRLLPEDTTIGESLFITTADDLQSQISRFQASDSRLQVTDYIFKAPYSGSGRGLRLGRQLQSPNMRSWLARCIREQGGVVAEPYYYNKVADFALEFVVTSQGVDFLGVSVFNTDTRNVYAGNIIERQKCLRQKISNLLPRLDFELLIDVVKREIACRFVGHYLGPVGVDMMVISEDRESDKSPSSNIQSQSSNDKILLSNAPSQSYKLHPCVEVNVRRTMGELSLHLLPLLGEGVEGFFRIIYNKDTDALFTEIASMDKPEYDGEGRLLRGTHLLTPMTEDTHYVALLET